LILKPLFIKPKNDFKLENIHQTLNIGTQKIPLQEYSLCAPFSVRMPQIRIRELGFSQIKRLACRSKYLNNKKKPFSQYFYTN
jgi:hypothetical protein